MPRPIHLSATAIREFLHCPSCYRYGYIEGLRPDVETESQRTGTNYHAMHEIYRKTLGDGAFNAAVDHLNSAYAAIPVGSDAEEWERERRTIAGIFAGHCWKYGSENLEVVASEIPFKIPLYHPKTRLPISQNDVVRVGKIDQLIRWNGKIWISDFKTTSKSIATDSEFWDRLRLDTQISFYVLAARDLHKAGMLAEYGIGPDEEIGGAFYDVVHKPTIKPKKLTQAETEEFCTTGKYLGQTFVVERGGTAEAITVRADGIPLDVEMGKKGFAVRESSAMFGARLLADIYERPEFYYARREIARPDKDIAQFQREIYGIYQTIKMMRDGNFWFKNDMQDSVMLHGSYGPLCYHNYEPVPGEAPPGFKRIFHEQEIA